MYTFNITYTVEKKNGTTEKRSAVVKGDHGSEAIDNLYEDE